MALMRDFKPRVIVVWVTAVLLATSASVGCGRRGPKLGNVTGRVTLDGQPVAKAIVTFAPLESGVASSGITNEDGTYTLTCPLGRGAVVGKHRVYVRTQAPGAASAAQTVDEDDPLYGHEMYASLRAPVFVDPIPARYNDKSELVREVKAGKNVIDLELTSKP